MLPRELEKRLIAMYLKPGVEGLESIATGQAAGIDKAVEAKSIELAERRGLTPEDAKKALSGAHQHFANEFTRQLAKSDASLMDKHMGVVVHYLKENHEVRLSASEKKALALKFLNATKQVQEAQSALYRGEWSPMELLKEKVERDLAEPYYDLKTVLEKYQVWYRASKPNVTDGTLADMEVECRVLLEIIGNTSIAEFNNMDTVARLKNTLRKYPLNKQQRYGDKPIQSIIKHERGYAVISLKTANEPLKRAKAVIDYANKAKMLAAANVYQGELFPTEKAAEEQRPAYDAEDVRRLIDAICAQSLWRYNPPKPERFWLILIALFHGFRLGNIVSLTKRDICQTDKGTWIFELRQGKTKATVRPVAICDSLLLLGFLEWVEGLKREKLFQDTTDSFSKWYNRDEKRSDGYEVRGFESTHVTADKGKCLYSIRHNFAGNVFDVSADYKITADMMGHSTGKSVTARYTKLTKVDTLKEISEKMQLETVDLDRLDLRAKELFSMGK